MVDYERVINFFTRSKVGYLGMLLGVIASGILVAPYSSPEYVYGWGVAILLTYIPRLVISFQFAKARKEGKVTPDNIVEWEDRVWKHSFLPFLAYSALAFLPYRGDALTGFMISAFSLTSMLTGGFCFIGRRLKLSDCMLILRSPVSSFVPYMKVDSRFILLSCILLACSCS